MLEIGCATGDLIGGLEPDMGVGIEAKYHQILEDMSDGVDTITFSFFELKAVFMISM